jgi:exosortase family protein XrtG
MTLFAALLLLAAWIYLMSVLTRSGLAFWQYLAGAFGIFLILMILVRPWATVPLARAVAACAGVVGNLTDTFEAYYKYGVLFIQAPDGAITMHIDLECSGIIEISAFLSLITFFRVYTVPERVLVGIIGALWTLASNALRITIICLVIHFAGLDYYYVAHTFVGRIVFYLLQVVLYFYVFTRPQVVRMRIGGFRYDHKKREEKEDQA